MCSVGYKYASLACPGVWLITPADPIPSLQAQPAYCRLENFGVSGWKSIRRLRGRSDGLIQRASSFPICSTMLSVGLFGVAIYSLFSVIVDPDTSLTAMLIVICR